MSETDRGGFWSRTLKGARNLWHDIAGAGDEASFGPTLSAKEEPALLKQMQACIDAQGGEVSARQRAARLGHAYMDLDAKGRKRFLSVMAKHFNPDQDRLTAAIERFQKASDEDGRRVAREELHAASRAPRLDLLTQFNALPQGVKFLVDMRADLIELKRDEPALESFDKEFQALLSSWFDIGFLEMQAIRWDSPASLLEKLIAYEAVHAIKSWDDLRDRLASDRRLFAFFHPRMPTEPLIFVEVALVNGIAARIHDLLDQSAPTADPDKADTAIFYSISNTQKGLRGIGFGNFLIKRVVDSLSAELPNLKSFATLSPIPGFMKWLRAEIASPDTPVLSKDDLRGLKKALGRKVEPDELPALLEEGGWINEAELANVLEEPLLRACARYLVTRRAKADETPMPTDPVARFHLSNGARIERINWGGDVTPKGLSQSAGIMVNYLYQLADIERNHERLMSKGTITYSGAVRSLLKS